MIINNFSPQTIQTVKKQTCIQTTNFSSNIIEKSNNYAMPSISNYIANSKISFCGQDNANTVYSYKPTKDEYGSKTIKVTLNIDDFNICNFDLPIEIYTNYITNNTNKINNKNLSQFLSFVKELTAEKISHEYAFRGSLFKSIMDAKKPNHDAKAERLRKISKGILAIAMETDGLVDAYTKESIETTAILFELCKKEDKTFDFSQAANKKQLALNIRDFCNYKFKLNEVECNFIIHITKKIEEEYGTVCAENFLDILSSLGGISDSIENDISNILGVIEQGNLNDKFFCEVVKEYINTVDIGDDINIENINLLRNSQTGAFDEESLDIKLQALEKIEEWVFDIKDSYYTYEMYFKEDPENAITLDPDEIDNKIEHYKEVKWHIFNDYMGVIYDEHGKLKDSYPSIDDFLLENEDNYMY